MNGAPNPSPAINPFERIISQAMQHLLYLLLLVQPVVGWAESSAQGSPVMVFGVYRLPDFLEKGDMLAKQLGSVHDLLALAIGGLMVLHIGWALLHYFVFRDGVMQRMLPRPTYRRLDS